MKLLAIDTTEETCSAALALGDEIICRFELAPRRHSELILEMMDSLLIEADLNLSDLDALAFARGPGSFTGLRIAAGVIQGAALGADLSVVPVSSLAALAQGVYREQGAENVLTALDARMGEVYWGVYSLAESGVMEMQQNEVVCAPDRVNVPSDEGWVGAGSGWLEYAAVLEGATGVNLAWPEQHIQAQDVAQLGIAGFTEGRAVDAALAQPVYIRDKVAEKSKRL